ncbi:MAG TPA: FkbM family methyltransferase [Phycisphaerales bacterium]|nr:FkbM family methyltransferase [Phycisphaerales bacterium]HRQ75940.1 FkbM family methyltransferase [Phycisphaerales bacterium]
MLRKVKKALAPVRRTVNQMLGRDVPFRAGYRCQKLRLGTDYGGWTVRPELIGSDSIVYSVGIGTDISFDLAMIERFGTIVHAFDPTPKSVEWLASQTLPQQFVHYPIGLADYDGTARFTLPNPDWVSFRMAGETETSVSCPVERLATLMQRLGHDRIDVLKMDIEGAEYPVVADILRSKISITQWLIEYHHTRGNRESLEKTRASVQSILDAGYVIFDIAPLGQEYAFCHAGDNAGQGR